eukprot:scaffold28633_cov61-Phaeocystis_antarctica.AAC.11
MSACVASPRAARPRREQAGGRVRAGGVCGRAGAALCCGNTPLWPPELVARYPLQKLNLRARRQSRVAVVATAAAAATAWLVMEPAACKHLIDLPDELLQQIMLATNVQAVVACAQACSMLASLVTSEELWEALCVASWPLVHRLPRPAYSSWR